MEAFAVAEPMQSATLPAATDVPVSPSMAFTVTADGVLSNNFIIMNLGLIAIAINLTFMIINIIDISMLGAGILLLLFGIALFTVNFLLARKIKKTKEEINNA